MMLWLFWSIAWKHKCKATSKTKVVRKCTLPWLNAKCYEAVRLKHDAGNSDEYTQVATECRQILVAERQKYLAELRTKMEALPRSSKKWWALNKQLLHRQAAPSFFPPLKDSEGTWHRTPIAKANAFAKCWVGKCRLPAEVHEHFFAHVEDQMSTWFPIRRRTVQKFLAGLKVDKATGPDGLSAIFLQRLAKVLSLPLAIIIRRIFNESTWPAKWRLHHIVPLFKRGSAFLPGQYRGVHLTSILSKVVERVIGNPLTAFLEARGYGDAQWAFRKNQAPET